MHVNVCVCFSDNSGTEVVHFTEICWFNWGCYGKENVGSGILLGKLSEINDK